METPNEISRSHRCEWKQNLAPVFLFQKHSVQWCQRQRLVVDSSHNTFCQSAKQAQYAFSYNFSKISLWLWILDTSGMEELSLENGWSSVCVSAMLYLFGSCNMLIRCGKLRWFIPDKGRCSGFQATVSLQNRNEFCTAFLVVFVLLCYITHHSVSHHFGACSGGSQEHPLWVFMFRGCLPRSSAAEWVHANM